MANGGEILGCQGRSAIIIGGATALELIRREDLAPLIAYSERVPAQALACKIVAPTQQQAARLLDAFECAAPLHCVVEGTGDRRRGAVRCQMLQPVRKGDVIMLDRGLYLLSPELLYLQLSGGWTSPSSGCSHRSSPRATASTPGLRFPVNTFIVPRRLTRNGSRRLIARFPCPSKLTGIRIRSSSVRR